MGWGVRMVIFRFIGLLLVVIALMFLGADVVSSFEHGVDLWSGDFSNMVVRSLGDMLALVHADIRPWIEQTLPSPVSDWLMTALSWPSWLDTGVLGLALGFIGGSGD